MGGIGAVNKKLSSFLNVGLSKDFLGLVLFGSGNDSDFVEGVSDLDYFLILNTINSTVLSKVESIRKKIIKEYLIPIDIKVLSIQEVECGLKGKSSCEFFNGWGILSIKKGYQQIICDCCGLKELFEESTVPIERFSDERLFYYLHKMRKLVQGKKHLFHNEIRKLNNREQYKIIVSCIKNVLTFSFASEGRFVYSNDDILKNVHKFELKKAVSKVFENKKIGYYDFNELIHAYNLIELYLKQKIESRFTTKLSTELT